MIINSSGNVGIGTSTPSVKLEVSGAAKITGDLNMNSSGRIINLVNPSSDQDAATKKYVVDTIAATTANNASTTYVDNAVATANVAPWFLPSGYNWRYVSNYTTLQETLNYSNNTIIDMPSFFSDYRRPLKLMYCMHFQNGPNFSNYNTNASYDIYIRLVRHMTNLKALPYYSKARDHQGGIWGPYSNNENTGWFLFNTSIIPATTTPQSSQRLVYGEITFFSDLQYAANSATNGYMRTMRMKHNCVQYGINSAFNGFEGYGQFSANSPDYDDTYPPSPHNWFGFEFCTPSNTAAAQNYGTNPGLWVEYYVHKT